MRMGDFQNRPAALLSPEGLARQRKWNRRVPGSSVVGPGYSVRFWTRGTRVLSHGGGRQAPRSSTAMPWPYHGPRSGKSVRHGWVARMQKLV